MRGVKGGGGKEGMGKLEPPLPLERTEDMIGEGGGNVKRFGFRLDIGRVKAYKESEMLDVTDFEGMVKRLARATGPADEETRKIYYEALKDYPRETVFRAMRRVAGTHGFYKFPTLAEVMDAVRDAERDTPRKIPVWCDLCNLTGFVLVEKDGHASVFRCGCRNGSRLSRGVRPFSDVAALYGEGEAREPEPLRVVTLEALGALADDHVFDGGVAVTKSCETCWSEYRVEHRRNVAAGDLKRQHARRPALCQPCYVKRGEEMGLWKVGE